MSHFSGEKDDSTSPTQKTLDRFFHSSDINSNTNGTNGASCIDVSGGHNDCNDAATKDESIHDAEKDVPVDQRPSHEENSSVPEGASSVNYDNEAASSSWKVCVSTSRLKFDQRFCSQEKACIPPHHPFPLQIGHKCLMIEAIKLGSSCRLHRPRSLMSWAT